jgi:uncharacterized protein YgbK (DUF1537 family)
LSELDTLDVRVLADDLTGALDSAVAFASPDNGIGVAWRLDRDLPGRMAVDVATREGDEAVATARHEAFASWLAAGRLSYKKIDSLLRGHVVAEIAACIEGVAYERVVIAPAFPFQGRVTREGRQWRLDRAERVGPDIGGDLARRFAVGRSRAGRGADARIAVYDAETDADLDSIVETVGTQSKTLWIGTGGLAAALARHLGARHDAAGAFRGPFLGLVGTNHEVTALQLRCFAAQHPDAHIVVGADVEGARGRLRVRMAEGKPSVVSIVADGERQAVARYIDRTYAALLQGLPKPGTLLVTGGETLRAVCDCLGVAALSVEYAIEPGLPVSRMKGGPFDGAVTISKSGAFGDPDLFSRLCGLIRD